MNEENENVFNLTIRESRRCLESPKIMSETTKGVPVVLLGNEFETEGIGIPKQVRSSASSHFAGPSVEAIDEENEEESGRKDYENYVKSYDSTLRIDEYASSNDSDDEDEIAYDRSIQTDDELESDFHVSDTEGDSTGSECDEDEFKNNRKAYSQPGSSKNLSVSCLVGFGSAAPCPFPPPPQKLGTKRRRKDQVASELPFTCEVRNLVQLLRTRTTLKPASEDILNGNVTSNSLFKTFSNAHTYAHKSVRSRGTGLELHKKENAEKLSKDLFLKMLCSDLKQQLKKEYFFWSQIQNEKLTPSSELHHQSCWKTAYKQFAKNRPLRRQYNEESVDQILQEAGLSCLKDVEKISAKLMNIMNLLNEWRRDIDGTLTRKLVFINKFRSLEADIELKDKKLDEFCHWGKKALDSLFSAPYFKLSSFDYTNLVPPELFLESVYDDALINERKQKWTNKDTATLKRTIKDVILDKEYASIVRNYNYLISRITYERTQRLQEDGDKGRTNQSLLSGSESFVFDELSHGNISKKGFRTNTKKRAADCEYAMTQVKRNFCVRDDAEEIKVNAKYTVKAQQLQKWFQVQESLLRGRTYEYLMKDDRVIKEIDWYKVSDRISAETGKNRTSKDCRLVWLHDADPKISHKRWSAADTNMLMELERNRDLNWSEIAAKIGGKTTYQCFFKYRNREVQTELMKWDEIKDNQVQQVLINEGPKWGKAVAATYDVRATKQQVQERWKKTINPILRNGAFTRVEDALLLLSIEQLKGFIQAEGHFGVLIAYLPWRFETVWRDRASNLFSNWIVPWTMEEDKKLLELAKGQGDRKNWQHISEQFTSFKNRKCCLTRHKILASKIGTEEGKFKNIAEYHEAYSMTRYNVFQYPHLPKVLELLEQIRGTKPPSTPFMGLSRDKPPSELELRWMLLEFDRDIMERTIQHLKTYIESRESYWKNWMTENGGIKKTFDRRKFHREDPRSVASAVHIRGLHLVSQDQVVDLSSFESSVYFHYVRFCRTKTLNRGTKRPQIPTAKKLLKLPEISRIVRLPSDAEDIPSGSDWDEDNNSFTPRKKGRPRKSVVPKQLPSNPNEGSSNSQKSVSKTKRKNVSTLKASFDGIPAKRAQGRPRKDHCTGDSQVLSPSFKADCSETAKGSAPLRRSTRNLPVVWYLE